MMDSALGAFRSFAFNYFQVDNSIKTSRKKKFSKTFKGAKMATGNFSNSVKSQLEVLESSHIKQFPQFRAELDCGFSLLFYGVGSKLDIIEKLCLEQLADYPIFIIDNFSFKFVAQDFGDQLLAHFDLKISQVVSLDMLFSSISCCIKERVMFLWCGMENLSNEEISLISLLADNPNVRFISMIENANFLENFDSIIEKRFNFIFHDLTTFQNYTFEFGAISRSTKKEKIDDKQHSIDGVAFVLASLPEKSKKLFILVAEMQLSGKNLEKSQLAALAVANFLISSEKLLNLAEFLDHELFILESEREVVKIPYSNQEISGILTKMQ